MNTVRRSPENMNTTHYNTLALSHLSSIASFKCINMLITPRITLRARQHRICLVIVLEAFVDRIPVEFTGQLHGNMRHQTGTTRAMGYFCRGNSIVKNRICLALVYILTLQQKCWHIVRFLIFRILNIGLHFVIQYQLCFGNCLFCYFSLTSLLYTSLLIFLIIHYISG